MIAKVILQKSTTMYRDNQQSIL